MRWLARSTKSPSWASCHTGRCSICWTVASRQHTSFYPISRSSGIAGRIVSGEQFGSRGQSSLSSLSSALACCEANTGAAPNANPGFCSASAVKIWGPIEVMGWWLGRWDERDDTELKLAHFVRHREAQQEGKPRAAGQKGALLKAPPVKHGVDHSNPVVKLFGRVCPTPPPPPPRGPSLPSPAMLLDSAASLSACNRHQK